MKLHDLLTEMIGVIDSLADDEQIVSKRLYEAVTNHHAGDTSDELTDAMKAACKLAGAQEIAAELRPLLKKAITASRETGATTLDKCGHVAVADLPKPYDGQFVAIWEADGEVWSKTLRWDGYSVLDVTPELPPDAKRIHPDNFGPDQKSHPNLFFVL